MDNKCPYCKHGVSLHHAWTWKEGYYHLKCLSSVLTYATDKKSKNKLAAIKQWA